MTVLQMLNSQSINVSRFASFHVDNDSTNHFCIKVAIVVIIYLFI